MATGNMCRKFGCVIFEWTYRETDTLGQSAYISHTVAVECMDYLKTG